MYQQIDCETLDDARDQISLAKQTGATRIITGGSVTDEGRYNVAVECEVAIPGFAKYSPYWEKDDNCV